MRIYPRVYLLVHLAADGPYVEAHASFESAKDAAKEIVLDPNESFYQPHSDELSIFNLAEEEVENLLTTSDILLWEDEWEAIQEDIERASEAGPRDEEGMDRLVDKEELEERKKVVRRGTTERVASPAERDIEDLESLEEEAIAMMDVETQAPPKEEKTRMVRVEEDSNRPDEGDAS